MDQIKFARPSTTTSLGSLPPFAFSPITIDIAACALDATPDEIRNAGLRAKKLLGNAMKKIERRLGKGHACLLGQLEASPAKRGDELDRYLCSDPHPDHLYTVIHFHGWLAAMASEKDIRHELVRAISGSLNQPRRIAVRERHYETQSLHDSISEYLDYSVKHDQSISSDPAYDDSTVRYAVSRFRLHLRGSGFKSTRVRIGVRAIIRTLDSCWKENRNVIYADILRLEEDGISVSAPRTLAGDYIVWKQLRSFYRRIDNSRRNDFDYTVLIYNSCSNFFALFLAEVERHVHATHFRQQRPQVAGYRSRAPP